MANATIRHRDMTSFEKRYLVVLNSSPEAEALWKLMENTIVLATEEAMDIDPARKAEKESATSKVYAWRAFYRDIRNMLQLEADSQVAEIRARSAEAELEDRENIERIVFEQETGIKYNDNQQDN